MGMLLGLPKVYFGVRMWALNPLVTEQASMAFRFVRRRLVDGPSLGASRVQKYRADRLAVIHVVLR